MVVAISIGGFVADQIQYNSEFSISMIDLICIYIYLLLLLCMCVCVWFFLFVCWFYDMSAFVGLFNVEIC